MALEERGRRITLKADISQLKTAFNKVNAIARESATELRKINNALRFNPNSTALLVQKQKELNREIAQSHKKVGLLKQLIAKSNEAGDVGAVRRLTNELENTRAKTVGLQKSLREVNATLANFGNIQALSKLENELKESRANAERLNNALKLDSGNIGLVANKFKELKVQAENLDKQVLLLVQDLQKIDYKKDPQGFNRLKSKLEETKAEAKRVHDELNKLGGVNFNPAVVQLEKLDNELKKSRETSKSLKRELEFAPSNSILKSLRLEEARNELTKTREKIKLLKSEMDKVRTTGSREEFTKLNVKIAESERHVKELITSVGILNAKRLDGLRGGFTAVGDSLEKNRQSIGNFARNVTLGYSLPVAYGSKRVIDTFRETDDTLRRVAAAASDGVAEKFTGAFASIESEVRDKSLGTVYSMNQIGGGLEALVKAGLTTKQAMGAVGHAMDLARADGIELERATEIITDGMNAMGLTFDEKGENVQRFVDVMNTAAVKSTTDVGQMGEAMKYAGAIVGTFGFEIEDVGVALAIMANQGIKASSAGTTLRGGLTNLVKPSKQAAKAMRSIGFQAVDSTGKMKPLSQIIQELREKTKGMTDAQKNAFIATVFGKTAMSGWSALLKETDENVKNFTESIKNSHGSTKAMADLMNSGVGGAIERFKASFSNAAYALGKAWGPQITSILNSLSDLLDRFTKASDGTKRFISAMIGIPAALAPITWALTKFISPWRSIIGLFKMFGKEAQTVSTVAGGLGGKTSLLARGFSALTTPMGLVVAGTTALAGASMYLSYKYDPLIVAQRKARESGERLGETFKKIGDAANEFKQKVENTTGVLDKVFGENNSFTNKLTELANTIQEKYGQITATINQATEQNRELTAQEAQGIRTNFEQISASHEQRLQRETQAYNQVVNIAKSAAANKKLSDDTYREQFASHVKQLQEIHTQSKQTTEDWYNKITEINNMLPENERMSMEQLNAIHQQWLANDQQHYSASMQAAIAAYSERYGIENGFISDLKTAKSGMEEVERQHAQRVKEIKDQFRGDIEVRRMMDKEEDTRYAQEKEWHLNQLAGKFDENRIKQLGTWLSLIQDTINNGGTLTTTQAANVQAFLATMDNMPQETKDKIIQGLKDAGVDVEALGTQLAGQMNSKGIEINSEFAKGLNMSKPEVETVMNTTLQGVKSAVDMTSVFSEANKLILSGRDGINAGKGDVDGAMSGIMKNTQEKVKSTDLKPVGQEKSQELAQGIKSKDGEVWNAAEQTANHGKNAAGSVDFSWTGQQMTMGLANGATSASWALENAMSSIVSRGLAAAKAAAGVASPARVFKREVGYWIAPGIAEGVMSNAGTFYKSITKTMDKGLSTAKNYGFSDKLNNMVNFSTVSDYAVQHTVSQNNVVVDTLNTLIGKVNDLELKSDIFLDGDKVGNATYRRHEVLDRRYGLI